MSRPWMPLYWGDLLRDTQHCDARLFGAYMLLIGEYWNRGGLPDDDESKRQIARLTSQEWRHLRPKLAAFFDPQWRHRRIDAEIEKAEIIKTKRQMAGMRGGDATRNKRRFDIIATAANARANARQMGYTSQSKYSSSFGEKGKEESSSRRSGFETLSEIVKSKGWTNE